MTRRERNPNPERPNVGLARQQAGEERANLGYLDEQSVKVLQRQEDRLQYELKRRQDIDVAAHGMEEQILLDGNMDGGERVVLAALFNDLRAPRPTVRIQAAKLLLEALGMTGKNVKNSKTPEQAMSLVREFLATVRGSQVQKIDEGKTELSDK